MADPSAEQVVYLSTQVAAALLENASLPEHDEALRRAVARWLPDADSYTIKTVAPVVRANLQIHRTLLLNRLDRLVADGRAEPL